MNGQDDRGNPAMPPVPHAQVTRRSRWSASLIWLVPVIAALVGFGMVVHNWREQGPVIEVSFITAEGLEAGKTQVKYKDVVVGLVDSIRLAPDHTHIIVRVNLAKDATDFATADARYWVVRPRFGTTGVSGIGTLLSGAYIAADTGASKESKTSFTGLERPPAIINGSPGKRFVLHAGDIGSLDVGSPVYFRRIQVGRVASYDLDSDGKQLVVDIFIDAPYDSFVNASTRFWNASGVDLNLDANGLKLNTQSLATVVAGGIAFQTLPGPRDATPAKEGTEFKLFDDLAAALAPPDGEPEYLRMRFEQSLRGLSVGAPVDFRGIVIGKVTSIDLEYDARQQRFPFVVGAVIYPQRLGHAEETMNERASGASRDEQRSARLLKGFVEKGLRAQARTGNLLTGQLYIALDFLPNLPRVDFDTEAHPLEIPTAPGSFDKLQEQMAGIVEKIDKLPLESIGKHLDSTIAQLDKALRQVNEATLPQFNATLAGAQGTLGSAQKAIATDAPLQQNLAQTLAEMQRAARSLRVLTDYLGIHPESLLRGKPADQVPRAAPEEKDAKGNQP